MKDYDYHGDWFLPGSESKSPGRLIIEEGTQLIILEIFGNNTIEGTVIKSLSDFERPRFHTLILGECTGLVTLYNCTLASFQVIGKEMYQIDYKVNFLFRGVHIINPDFLVQTATFKYPFLSSWYDGWQSHDKIKLEESADLGIKAKIGEVDSDNINVTDNLTLKLFDRVYRQMIEIGVHHAIKYQKYITFRYKNPVSIETVISDAGIFKKLLEFTSGQPISYKLISIQVSKDFVYSKSNYQFYNEDLVTCYVRSYTLYLGKDVNQHDRHQNSMLVSRWNCGKDELDQVIKKWYANKHLHSVYDYYIDSNNWMQGSDAIISNIMFNNKFLNLIQALEDYHRKCLNHDTKAEVNFQLNKQQVLKSIKDPILKKWLNDNFKPPKHIRLEEKLQAILDLIKPIFLPTFTDHPIFNAFPTYAKDKRNELSHGKNKETYQGEAFHINFYLAQISLGICILYTLEVSAINGKIEHYHHWNDQLAQIIEFKV